MAATKIRKGEALIWLPSRSVGERAFASEPRLIVLAGEGGYQRMSLDALGGIRMARLIFDARDVSLHSLRLPPLKGARLRQALPAALEDLLLQDPSQCLMAFVKVPHNEAGLSTVAALDKAWFEFVLGALERRKITVTGAHAAQLVLPASAGSFEMALLHEGLALSWLEAGGARHGLGWGASADADFSAESIRHALQTATLALAAHDVDASRWPLRAFIEDAQWQAPLDQALRGQNRVAQVEHLPRPERLPLDWNTLDFMPSRSGTALSRWAADTDWRQWRLPFALGAAAVSLFLLGLNLHWGALSQEKQALRQQIERRFRQAFPSVPVVVDPLAQGQKELNLLRARNGQSGPDDFLPLLARLSLALGNEAGDSLSSVEYREGRLRLRLRPERVADKTARDALVQSARRVGLKLVFEDERQGLAVASAAP